MFPLSDQLYALQINIENAEKEGRDIVLAIGAYPSQRDHFVANDNSLFVYLDMRMPFSNMEKDYTSGQFVLANFHDEYIMTQLSTRFPGKFSAIFPDGHVMRGLMDVPHERAPTVSGDWGISKRCADPWQGITHKHIFHLAKMLKRGGSFTVPLQTDDIHAPREGFSDSYLDDHFREDPLYLKFMPHFTSMYSGHRFSNEGNEDSYHTYLENWKNSVEEQYTSEGLNISMKLVKNEGLAKGVFPYWSPYWNAVPLRQNCPYHHYIVMTKLND